MLSSDLVKRVQVAVSAAGARVFRMQVGLGWTGEAVKIQGAGMILAQPGDVLIRQARPFKTGVVGMSDLGGWTPIIVTPEMVGKTVAITTWFEVKSGSGRATKEQAAFIEKVRLDGGIGAVVRSEKEAVEGIKGGV